MDKTEKIAVFILFVLLGLWFVNFTQKQAEEQKKLKEKQAQEALEKEQNPNPAKAEDGDSGKSKPEDKGGETGSDKSGDTTTKDPAPKDPAPEKPPTPEIDDPADKLLPEFTDLKAAGLHVININGKADVTIDPEKGGIIDILMHDYIKDDSDEKVRLGDRDFPMHNLRRPDGELDFSHARIISKDEQSLKIERQIKGSTVVLIQSWKVQDELPYKLNYSIFLENRGSQGVKLGKLEMLYGTMFPMRYMKNLLNGSRTFSQQLQYLESGENSSDIENLANIWNLQAESGDEELRNELADVKTTWSAVQNKYFISIIARIDPEKNPLNGTTYRCPAIPLDEKQTDDANAFRYLNGYLLLNPEFLEAKQKFARHYSCYIGPKAFQYLDQLGHHKEQNMGFGIFIGGHWGPMQTVTNWIYKLVIALWEALGSIGIAIILTTVIIRVLFWPIIHRSNAFSQRMKKLQPEMKGINEKYKGDAMAKQEAIMALYKKHGMSPLAPLTTGCLPLLIQIPVFIGLYNLLRSSIEMWQRSFVYIPDLSMPDTIFALAGLPLNPMALAMGISMFFYQKQMPPATDPMQQRMMNIMPIMMVVGCYSLPSGLTLYWTVSNLCSIVQYKVTQKILKKKFGDEPEGEVAKAGTK